MPDPLSAFVNDVAQWGASKTIGPSERSGQVPWLRRHRRLRARWAEVTALLKTTGSISEVRRAEHGITASVRLTGRHAAQTLLQSRETVAAVFRVARVDARPDPLDVSRATLLLFTRDLLEEYGGALWPDVPAPRSLWDPIRFGWDELGAPVGLEVMGRHSLFAGETGSGKTAGQTMIAATAALDPTVRLFVCDPNEMLWQWKPLAERYVVADPNGWTDMFELILREHADRNEIRRKAGLDKWSRELAEESGRGPIVLLVDEAPEVLLSKEARDQLRRVVLRTRISGVHASLTIQAPNATIIDTPLRGQLGLRAVFRVADKPASSVALGTSVVDASEISAAQRGVCFLHQDGAVPTRMRTFYLPPERVRALAAEARELRA